MHLLTTIKESYFDAATEWDLAAAKHVLRRESQKLSLLDSRLEIYATVLQQVAQVAFNEIRLATDHTSNNDTKVKRTIVTFRQAGMLVDAVSLTEIAKTNKLIVNISKISPWNYSLQCYLMLDVFQSGTMQVEKRRFCTQYVQIKYFEASWPGALVAHRIQPLHGSMHAHTKKRHRDDERNHQLRSCSDEDEQQEHAQNYAFMLHNLMVTIQEYLLLSDNKQQGAVQSLKLVGNTAQLRDDNRICILA